MHKQLTLARLAALAAAGAGEIDNFIAVITPGGIEAQEAAGQATLVNSAMLPKEMLRGCTRDKLEAMGVKFGADVDDLFVTVTLPDGWKKRATNHSMWSELIDEKGRVRALIFYKAAFYDRRATISLCARYSADNYMPCDSAGAPVEYGSESHMMTAVKDANAVIHVVGIREDGDRKTRDEHQNQAEAWLNDRFPSWRDPAAYWE
jgi:hypothetical protein